MLGLLLDPDIVTLLDDTLTLLDDTLTQSPSLFLSTCAYVYMLSMSLEGC